MYIQDALVVNLIKASLDDVLGERELDNNIHEETAAYLTDLFFGSGLIVDDSAEAIQEILDYITINNIKTRLSTEDSDSRDLPDSFTLNLIVNILDVTLTFKIDAEIHRQYRSVFP